MKLSDVSISTGYSHHIFARGTASSRLFLIFFFMVSAVQCLQPMQLSARENDPAALRTTTPAENDVSSFRIKIRRLQQGILNQETQIEETEDKERNILEEMEILDSKLVRHQEKLRELEAKMQEQQAQIDREEIALGNIRDEKAIVENHLKKRITAYYTMGDIGLLNVTFSTKTLPELLTFHDAFDTLIQYDQDVIKVYVETMKEIERTKTALDLEKSILQEFIKQIVEETEILEQTKNEKRMLLTHVRTKSKLHQQAIDEMQQASEDLSRSIVSLKTKHQVSEQGFLTNKGSLPPPVDGVIITLFLQEKVNKLGMSRKSQGIELKAPDGTKIVAVAEGEVIFSGYLRGYGNTIIIHHGLQYYTVTSRIEKLLVKKGQKVKAEKPIGIMGDTAVLFDEGIYFEIRHGRQSMDPLIWLNPNRLSTLHEHSTELPGVDSPVQ